MIKSVVIFHIDLRISYLKERRFSFEPVYYSDILLHI